MTALACVFTCLLPVVMPQHLLWFFRVTFFLNWPRERKWENFFFSFFELWETNYFTVVQVKIWQNPSTRGDNNCWLGRWRGVRGVDRREGPRARRFCRPKDHSWILCVIEGISETVFCTASFTLNGHRLYAFNLMIMSVTYFSIACSWVMSHDFHTSYVSPSVGQSDRPLSCYSSL